MEVFPYKSKKQETCPWCVAFLPFQKRKPASDILTCPLQQQNKYSRRAPASVYIR